MPSLTELKEQLEKLPKRKELKILAGGMKKYRDLIEEATATLKGSAEGARFAQAVFPEEDFDKVLDRVRLAAKLAAKLRRRFAEDINSVSKSSSENDVTRLGEQAKAARAALRDAWKTLLSERIEPHERLVAVVREIPELAPQGGAMLGALLDDLRVKVGSRPTSQAAADTIREGLDDLPRVIENLGLKGEVGDFLVQAASGQGDPKQLYQPAIRDFFENRPRNSPLWDLIRVKIR